ncbi:MAG: hypothetical protein AAGG02_01085 [Cyanobacteria bacterium P01_H01_bin.15]
MTTINQFNTLNQGAPDLPAALVEGDNVVEKYLIDVLRQANAVEERINEGLDRADRTNKFTWEINEDGTFDARIRIPVVVSGIQVA